MQPQYAVFIPQRAVVEKFSDRGHEGMPGVGPVTKAGATDQVLHRNLVAPVPNAKWKIVYVLQ